MSKIKYYKREFLNLEGSHALAAIETKVEETHGGISAFITISDCYKCVTLDFDEYDNSVETLDNINHKIDLLHEIVTNFKKALKPLVKKEKEKIRKKQ